jgi:hypothetical protein
MFEWIRRLLRDSDLDQRRSFVQELDSIHAEHHGGQPIVASHFLGTLKLRSGTLILGDPQNPPSVEVPNVPVTEVGVSARLWRYPSGLQRVASLTLVLGDQGKGGLSRTIGHVPIDSAKLVVLDKRDFEEHWTEVGPDRIGVISTAPDDAVLRLLTRQFRLRTVRVDRIQAKVVGPVSVALEKEIEDYLKSIPKYASFPYILFRVETKNSFERANHMERAWDFIPVGNLDKPLMFVCSTGHGDGSYDVKCSYSGEVPIALTIEFSEDGLT